jgi:hypothetical protein
MVLAYGHADTGMKKTADAGTSPVPEQGTLHVRYRNASTEMTDARGTMPSYDYFPSDMFKASRSSRKYKCSIQNL